MYTAHFRLRSEPFALTPDPSYLYLNREYHEALAALKYGLLDRRGFISLVGEVGTGKTTLVHSLLGLLGDQVQTAYVAHTAQTIEELLQAALKDLGVVAPHATKRSLLDALNAHLMKRADQGGTTALLIDEAQNLSDRAFEELRLLSNFETFDSKLLQIVLVGQPELQDRLRQPNLRQLRERVSVRAFINPLSRREIRNYVEHRLRRAGRSAGELFSPRALRLIARRSQGIPRRVNILCHNALLFAYGRNLSRVSGRIAREVIAEMDDRRPGLVRREAVRRVEQPWVSGRWAAGLAVVLAVIGMILFAASDPGSRLTPRSRPPQVSATDAVASMRADATPAALEPDPDTVATASAAGVEPRAKQTPGNIASEESGAPSAAYAPTYVPGAVKPEAEDQDGSGAVVEARLSSPRVSPEPPAGHTPAVVRVAPSLGSPSKDQHDADEPRLRSDPSFVLTVQKGITLFEVARQYGKKNGKIDYAAFLSEILRLNPWLKSVDRIRAGDRLRVPVPAVETATADEERSG